MKKSATDSSHGSTQHLGKGTYSLVLSLADQKLTLEKNDNLGQFDDELVTENKIPRKPWKRSIHLEVTGDRAHPEEPYSYPVDIRLDSVSRLMMLKRLLGIVGAVRVYTGPLTKV